ncbi:hypothetical protein [Ruegeria profundi]|uniref:hypothetical protein n=1 Tax=Ruegeria profundi TaxID=1685378 RepID=UPI001CD6DA1A|nr:hypothetical protein [Ruegeria profundi]MCA0930092.1 hypothetical protein [Ruegeria profundi]
MANDLKDELPELLNALSSQIEPHAFLSEAIEDLGKVCAKLKDTSITASEREEWAHIKTELLNELRRLAKRKLRNTSD